VKVINKKTLKYLIVSLLVPTSVFTGVVVFEDRKYIFISLMVAVLSCVPFFLSFENQKNSRKIVIVAVITALCVIGRFVFVFIPFFKPVAAIIIIGAIYLGPQAGFMIGALSAIISNMYFGQGPWTPFQMMVWGIIGLIAGLLFKMLKSSKIALYVYGALSGVAFSLIMDVWTVMWVDGTFNPTLYKMAIITSLPFMGIYALSNVFFLIVFFKPLGKKLERVIVKYGCN